MGVFAQAGPTLVICRLDNSRALCPSFSILVSLFFIILLCITLY